MKGKVLGIILLLMIIIGVSAYFIMKEPKAPVKEIEWKDIICPNDDFVCGEKLSCEDKVITINGYIGGVDEEGQTITLIDKKDGEAGSGNNQNLEIGIVGGNEIYYNNLRQKESQKELVTVTGIVKGRDYPVNGDCQRWYYIVIDPLKIK